MNNKSRFGKVFIDKLPKDCFECPCFDMNRECPCGLDEYEQGFFLDDIDGGDCPLKSLSEYDRIVEERVLFDVLQILYFQDYNKSCNYEKMSGKELVEAQHKVLDEIQERYNYYLRDDWY